MVQLGFPRDWWLPVDLAVKWQGLLYPLQATAEGIREWGKLIRHSREVFIAQDDELHREVAFKEIQERHAGHASHRARFLLEAEITGGLEHPGIVPVYSLGQYADGRPFYAMRFIKGDNLKSAIEHFHRSRELAPAVRETNSIPRVEGKSSGINGIHL